MAAQDVIRRLTIQATSSGVDQTTAQLKSLSSAQSGVAVTSDTMSKATLSVEKSLASVKRSLDAEYASEVKLEQIHRTLTAARAQGLISINEENRLLGLAKTKYTEAGEAAKFMGERIATVKEVGTSLLALLGGGVLFAGIAELPSKLAETVDMAAKLNSTAETIGITAKNLQELDYAAKLSDVSTESMNEALEKFSKNIGQAQTGTGQLAQILKANHVVISGNLNKDLESYANLIARASSEEQRNFLVTTAFGKSAAEMGNLFKNGAAGLEAYAKQADNAGLLSEETLKKAEEMNKEMVKVQQQLGTTFQQFLIDIAPALIKALQDIAAAVKRVQDVYHFLNPDKATIERRLALANGYPDPSVSSNIEDRTGSKFGFDGAAGNLLVNGTFSSLGNATTYSSRSALAKAMATSSGVVIPTAAGDEQAKAIKRVTDSLKLQTEALTETNRQAFIDKQLSDAKVTAASSEGKAIEKLAATYYDQKKAIDDANQASQFFSTTIADAFMGVVDGSTDAVSAIKNITKALADAVLQSALLGSGPLAGIFGTAPAKAGEVGGIFGALTSLFHPSANGNVFSGRGIAAYSSTVVSRPTLFPFAAGVGLMGEAGPEAIMPLKRTSTGALGVQVANQNEPGGSSSSVVRIELADGLKAEILQQSGQQTVQIVKKTVPQMIASGAPTATVKARRDRITG